MSVLTGGIDRAAERLQQAALSGVACAPLRGLIAGGDIDAAYQVQRRLTEWRVANGARVIGRKIGLTSVAVQQQIGVDRPDFGVLFDDMRYEDGVEIPIEGLIQPKVEAEVAFVLARDIRHSSELSAVRDAVELVFPAVEVVDSRIADWRIGITDTIADNASSGVFVIGREGSPLDRTEPVGVVMSMRRGQQVVSRGTGKDCLGDPLRALKWLAATAIEFGEPLRAGDLVLSGALGPMVDVRASDVFVADIAPLGTVTARFSTRERQG